MGRHRGEDGGRGGATGIVRAAEAAKAGDRRVSERRLQWQWEGMYLSWAEIEAGEPCQGCGQPLPDGLGGWYPLDEFTPGQRAECERAGELCPERHRGCRSRRRGLRSPGSALRRLLPPLTAQQTGKAVQILSSARMRPEDPRARDLALACGHTARLR
jgi:hypothetical protein